MATMITSNTETSTDGSVLTVWVDENNDGSTNIGAATSFAINVTATGTFKAGTVTLEVITNGGEWEQIVDDTDATISVDITAPKVVKVLDIPAYGFRATPVGFSGVDSYTVTVSGW